VALALLLPNDCCSARGCRRQEGRRRNRRRTGQRVAFIVVARGEAEPVAIHRLPGSAGHAAYEGGLALSLPRCFGFRALVVLRVSLEANDVQDDVTVPRFYEI